MNLRKYTNRRYLDALAQRVLIFDGAMGTNLHALNLTSDHFGGERYAGCNDYLVLSYPQAVETIHRSFFEAGVDVIETDTFRSNRITLQEYGLQEQVRVINHSAAALAKRLAEEYSTPVQPRFVAGSMGPTGKLPSAGDPELSNVSFDELAKVFCEQAIGLIEGGVDLLLLETSQDILEVKAAIHGINLAFEQTGIYLPIQAQITMDTNSRMLLGTDIGAALTTLEGLSIDVIGMNCSTGPEHMREPIQFLSENAPFPVSIIPNAGLPINVDGEAVYPLQPESYAEIMMEFIEKYHVNVVGGCCGTTPAHLKRLVERLQIAKGYKQLPRPQEDTPRLSSGVQAAAMRQEPAPFLIGERCNAQGSREFKRLLLSEDYDSILTIARQQVDNGAHALDISVAVTESGEEEKLMHNVVRKLVVAGIHVPLVIDTTEPTVMEVALKVAPGRCLLNSTHLEAGHAKADVIFKLAKTYNAAVIVLTIDEDGMAKTIEHKLAVARRIYDIAVNDHGLKPQDLVFDDLTFTLATGDPELADSALATIDGIRRIKTELQGVFTSLGVSNVSFGLSKNIRPVVNSVFLYHCVLAGLDMAIINPAQITPYSEIPQEQRVLAEDLIFNRRHDALQRILEYFSNQTSEQDSSSKTTNPLDTMSAEQRLHYRILYRHKDGIEADIDELIHNSDIPSQVRAVNILNEIMLPAMKEVGDKFGAGELILPFVLQSAEVMKKAVSYLENYLGKEEGITKGTIILATVYGDVHDIGKNLVKTILSNNGYTVVDLGKQVPAETIISKALELKADAIGLSALLVSTSKQMPLVVNDLHRRGLHIPVLIGGAAINRRFGHRVLITESGEPYAAGVFYCKDAFEGLEKMDRLKDPVASQKLLQTLQLEVESETQREEASIKPRLAPTLLPRPQLPPAPHIPKPPFWGVKTLLDLPLEDVFHYIPKNDLFRLSWGAKNAHGQSWLKLQGEFETRLADMQHATMTARWLHPQAVYGYFPAQSDGDELIVYDPAADTGKPLHEISRFAFPRQNSGEYLCLADYFAPVSSGVMDVVAFQIVTVGNQATQRFEQLQEAGDYSEAYFFHGLAVQTAEAAADYLHHRIRQDLGLLPGQGKRYSWGYPAVPELEDHRKVFDLLPAENDLGMILTSAYQLVPEQSTAAIILHHPAAKYFSTGGSRVDQALGTR